MLYRHAFDKISTKFCSILRVFVNFAGFCGFTWISWLHDHAKYQKPCTSNDRFLFKWSVQSSVQCIDIYICTEAQATFNILFRVIWIFYSHFLILCNLLFKHKQHPFEGSNIKGLNLQEKENKIYNQKTLLPCNDQATAYDKDFTSSETEGMITPENVLIIIKESNRAWKPYYKVVGDKKIFLIWTINY